MDIKQIITDSLIQSCKKLNYDDSLVYVTFSDRLDLAHYQCNSAFALAKINHTSPLIIAQSIVDNLQQSDCFDVSIANPGFINFKVTDSLFSELAMMSINDSRLCIPTISNDLVIVDFGGANVAKPLHVGHLRPAIIGQALYNLYAFLGHKVVSDVHLGDWGLQMGLTIAQLMDDYNMGYYFGQNVPKQELTTQMLDVEYPKASLRKKEDLDFYDRASEITLKLQQKEKGYYDIWKEMRNVSVDDVKHSYDLLGVSFDIWNGESSCNDIVPHVVDILKQKGLAYISDGALVVDVKDIVGMDIPPAIILKHNGAQMYMVTELATILQRVTEYPSVKNILYVTDARQALHFKQAFGVTRIGHLINDDIKLTHIGHGTINGTDGKPFKTRDGGTVKLNAFIQMVKDKATEKLKNNGIENNDILANQIALSAIKFGDLSNIVSKDYIFDIDKFTTFEGKTGPYIQYSAVRITSLLNKAQFDKNSVTNINIYNDEMRNIMLNILKLHDSYMVAYKENSLNSLCLAVYDLASSYSNFYNNIHILSEPDNDKKQSYLALSYLVYQEIKNGLKILGIQIPEKM